MVNASDIQGPTSNRKVWQKGAYDVADQTTSNATNIGFLRKDDSRIDVIATMDKGMKTQVFTFQNLTGDKTLLAAQGTKMRIQVLNQAGHVIADSKAGMGAASKAYTALTQGTYDLKKGTYYVQVQRLPGTSANTQERYNFQIKQGDGLKNDYITNAVPTPAKIQQEQAVANVQQLNPTMFSNTTKSIFGSTASDPFGLGGYDIFGQKKPGY